MFVLSLLAAASLAHPSLDNPDKDTTDKDNPNDHGSSVYVGGGPSIPMVGSWERRAGVMAGYETWRHEPRLQRFLGPHIATVWSFYGMYHEGRDGRYEPDPTWAGGFTYGYRKYWEDAAGRGVALEAYWGGIMGSRGSRDLPSSLNSTPGLELSWLRPFGARNMNLDLRYEHMSNGGTYEPNRGENFFLLLFDFRIH